MNRQRGREVDRECLRAVLAVMLYERDAGDSTPAAIGRRLAHVRACAGVNQIAMTKHTGVALRVWQYYERGVRSPHARILTALQQLGINPAWVLTGAGAVLLDDDVPEASSPVQVNEWGLTGECPASSSAKKPAAGARYFRVAGVGTWHGDGTISLCVSLQGPGEGVG